MLRAAESVQIVGVRIASIEVNAVARSARIDLQCTDNSALLHYLEEINAGESHARWTVAQTRSGQGPVGAVAATIEAHWVARE